MDSPSPQDDIVVRDLTKRFGDLEAVKGVSFAVHKAEIFGILGPNGAGKTTTLECIEGLQEPTSGSATVLGMDARREPRKVKDRIGVQLQASTYFDYLKVREILDLFARFYSKSLDTDYLLQKFGLAEKSETVIKNLSGGQQQRFTIAATLINDPEVIFLDEPTTGLDPHGRRNVWEFIREIHREGRTVVLTTHYMEEAQTLCDRVAIMDGGRIVALDTPQGLIDELDAPYEVRIRLEGSPEANGLEGLPGVVSTHPNGNGELSLRSSDATKTLPELFAWAARSNVELARLEVQPATLEDVFLALTGHELTEEA